MSVMTDADRGVDRPVRDLTILNFDDDRVDEDRRVHTSSSEQAAPSCICSITLSVLREMVPSRQWMGRRRPRKKIGTASSPISTSGQRNSTPSIVAAETRHSYPRDSVAGQAASSPAASSEWHRFPAVRVDGFGSAIAKGEIALRFVARVLCAAGHFKRNVLIMVICP